MTEAMGSGTLDATVDARVDGRVDGRVDATMDRTAVVLCGGSARRFGDDKLAQRLGSLTVLDTLLTTLPPGWPVVAVGRRRSTARPVTWTHEDPADSGPLAAIAAGSALVGTDLLVVIAGDMPFAAVWAVRLAEILAVRAGLDAVVAQDGAGRANPLLGAYRTVALRSALPAESTGRAARLLLDALAHERVRVPDDDALDVDTVERLEVARRRLAP